MKLPDNFDDSIEYEEAGLLYPPLGFYPFIGWVYDNGDQYGLYWPIGKEDAEPMVAETYHDEASLQPHYSTYTRFQTAVTTREFATDDDDDDDDADDDFDDEFENEFEDSDDDDEFDDDDDIYLALGRVSLNVDPQSPTANMKLARRLLKNQEVDRAIACLETAVTVIPEYTEAQALLSAQYRRTQQLEKAILAAWQAVISPPCFDGKPTQIAGWFWKQKTEPPQLADDPIWRRRERLTMRFGGVAENDQYQLLRDAIDEYLDQARYIPAMTLMQTYAQHMGRETGSFQERNEFQAQEYVDWQKEVAETRHGKKRELAP